MTIYSQLEKSLLDWKAVPLQMALFTLYLRYHHHPEGDEVGTETILLFLQIFIKHLVLPGTTGGFPGGSDCKESAYNAGDIGSIPGLGRSPGEGSILAWRLPWREKPGRLQSMRSQRVGHNWATNTLTFFHFTGRNAVHWEDTSTIVVALNFYS